MAKIAIRNESRVRERQDPLRRSYRTEPERARITDRARTVSRRLDDPFHGDLVPGDGYDALWSFGIHRAVGGLHDAPNPGDILCSALAACLDSTLRMIADRLGIELETLEVEVTAEVDVRGTLAVDPEVPVGFQSMRCSMALGVPEATDPEAVGRFLQAAEHSCVVLQTLRGGVPVECDFDVTPARAELPV